MLDEGPITKALRQDIEAQDETKAALADAMPVGVYMTKTFPYHYIVHSRDEGWLLVPLLVRCDGWEQRTKYYGHIKGLVRCAPFVVKAMLLSTGTPPEQIGEKGEHNA